MCFDSSELFSHISISLPSCILYCRFDTIRRRMQVQNLHLAPEQRLTSVQQFTQLVHKEGLKSLYRGLTPELLKVVRFQSCSSYPENKKQTFQPSFFNGSHFIYLFLFS